MNLLSGPRFIIVTVATHQAGLPDTAPDAVLGMRLELLAREVGFTQ